ncbi:hypothetical protein M422DRAFT_28357 [Sphaerobolus stellatus SS14]|nr:hypothetical protein M422DRAFT_28357 [Sphaerobolus stellatus SS14]
MMHIHDLPLELIQHIFALCMEPPEVEETVYCLGLINRSFETRLSLTLVSKGWRLLAKSTPDLWTLILFQGDCSHEKNIALTRTWFSLSGVLPLNLLLITPSNISETFLELIRSNMHRCRIFHSTFSPEYLGINPEHLGSQLDTRLGIEDLFPVKEICLPRLRSLSSFRNYSISDLEYVIHAPNLRTLDLGNHALSTLCHLTSESLRGLHTLDISHPWSWDQLDLNIFKNCINLRHLFWTTNDPFEDGLVADGIPINLPFLTNLSFADISREFTPFWLKKYFNMPMLKHISYICHECLSESTSLNINHFASYSKTLNTLRLSSFTLTGVPYNEEIPAFPNLEVLILHSSNIQSAFFNALGDFDGSSPSRFATLAGHASIHRASDTKDNRPSMGHTRRGDPDVRGRPGCFGVSRVTYMGEKGGGYTSIRSSLRLRDEYEYISNVLVQAPRFTHSAGRALFRINHNPRFRKRRLQQSLNHFSIWH